MLVSRSDRTLPGCPVQVERRGLEAHLSECTFSRECPNGCGHTLLSHDQSQHNCVSELRTEVEMLRSVFVFPRRFPLTCILVTILLWKPGQGRDAVQSGGAEAGDGVPLGLAEKTHGAERVAAEE